jgi:hypothetical protein
MPLMKWKRPTLRGMHATSRKLLMIPAQGGRFGLQAHVGLPIAGREARLLQRRRMSHRDGGGVLIGLLALNTGRGHCRARILRFTAPRTERPGRGAERGYSFVSMSHHTARGKARPVMG